MTDPDPKEPELRDADTEPDDKASELPEVRESRVPEGDEPEGDQ